MFLHFVKVILCNLQPLAPSCFNITSVICEQEAKVICRKVEQKRLYVMQGKYDGVNMLW